MDVDLCHYLATPTISLHEGAKILSGIEPKECFISLESDYEPFDSSKCGCCHKDRHSKAKTLFGLLKAELVRLDNKLDIVNLTAIIRGQGEKRRVVVSDEPVSFEGLEKFRLSSVHPDALVQTDSLAFFDINGIRHISVKNPDEHIKKGLCEDLCKGRFVATGLTTVTSQSLAEWASSKGIDSIFTRLLVAEEPTTSFQESDVPMLLAALVEIDSDFINPAMKAAIETQHFLCVNGSKGRSTRQVLVDHIEKKHGIAKNTNENERITMLVHPTDSRAAEKKGTQVIMQSFANYMAQKEVCKKTKAANKRTAVMNAPWRSN